MAKDRIVMPAGEKQSFGDQLPPKQTSWRSQMQRFVIEIDGQAKSDFPTKELADVEAARLRAAFPKLQVRVADWATDSVRTLGPTQSAPEPEEQAD